MAASKRKSSKKKTIRARIGTIARIERELPPTLREYTKNARKGLSDLEKELERATAKPRKQLAALLKDVSRRFAQLEDRIEETLSIGGKKKAAKKKAGKKKTAKKKTAKKAAKKKTTKKK